MENYHFVLKVKLRKDPNTFDSGFQFTLFIQSFILNI